MVRGKVWSCVNGMKPFYVGLQGGRERDFIWKVCGLKFNRRQGYAAPNFRFDFLLLFIHLHIFLFYFFIYIFIISYLAREINYLKIIKQTKSQYENNIKLRFLKFDIKDYLNIN